MAAARKERSKLADIGVSFISGGGASSMSKTLVAPFERVKLLLQTNQMMTAVTEGQRPYSGIIDTLRRIPSEQGFFSFWRGNLTNCARIIPTYALRFTLFDHFKALVSVGHDPGECLPLTRQMISGGLSGGTTVLVTHPLDLARTRLAADTRKVARHSGLLSIVKTTYRTHGFPGMYQGLVISTMEIVPYTAIAMGGYEYLKSTLPSPDSPDASLPMLVLSKLGAGWISGLCGSLTCYPVDTIKRQMMLDGADGFKSRYGGRISTCVTMMVKEGGIRCFYNGCMINAMKSSPAAAITLVTNDFLRWLLGFAQ